uniref:Uncharacterized protein n=1 Tax=Steinernema glaseri TaxID=37863 RepID=A0A1I7ZB76_9BILA
MSRRHIMNPSSLGTSSRRPKYMPDEDNTPSCSYSYGALTPASAVAGTQSRLVFYRLFADGTLDSIEILL